MDGLFSPTHLSHGSISYLWNRFLGELIVRRDSFPCNPLSLPYLVYLHVVDSPSGTEITRRKGGWVTRQRRKIRERDSEEREGVSSFLSLTLAFSLSHSYISSLYYLCLDSSIKALNEDESIRQRDNKGKRRGIERHVD